MYYFIKDFQICRNKGGALNLRFSPCNLLYVSLLQGFGEEVKTFSRKTFLREENSSQIYAIVYNFYQLYSSSIDKRGNLSIETGSIR